MRTPDSKLPWPRNHSSPRLLNACPVIVGGRRASGPVPARKPVPPNAPAVRLRDAGLGVGAGAGAGAVASPLPPPPHAVRPEAVIQRAKCRRVRVLAGEESEALMNSFLGLRCEGWFVCGTDASRNAPLMRGANQAIRAAARCFRCPRTGCWHPGLG